jgi:hypothetical protein
MEWTINSGFSTAAEVLKRMHHDRYLKLQQAYLARCKLALSGTPSLTIEPFSAYEDKTGYAGSSACLSCSHCSSSDSLSLTRL